MLLVHLAGSFIIVLCPRSLDYNFLKYGQFAIIKKKKYVLRQVLQIHSFFFFFKSILMEPIFIHVQMSLHSTPVI